MLLRTRYVSQSVRCAAASEGKPMPDRCMGRCTTALKNLDSGMVPEAFLRRTPLESRRAIIRVIWTWFGRSQTIWMQRMKSVVKLRSQAQLLFIGV